MRATHPNRPIRFQHALAAAQPFKIEVVVFVSALGLVPVAFVHLNHSAGVTGDPAIRQEIRWISKDTVEAAFGVLGDNGVEHLQRVAVVEPNAAPLVLMRQNWGALFVAALNGNRAIFAEFKVRW